MTVPSYTVDALLEKLGVVANVQVWKSINTITYVQGIVSKVKPYNRIVYFDLIGGSTKLSVKCPIEFRPQEGDSIVVEGLPMLRPSRFGGGLDVILDGKPVADVTPPKPNNDEPIVELEKDRFARLHDYLSMSGVDNFCVLGTETAIRDVFSQIQPDIQGRIQRKIIRVSEKDSMLSDLKKETKDCSAFAIVRGGDDESLSLWNDPSVVRELLSLKRPFYVALGHTHFISLTTQYADESFHTPTDFGMSLNAIVDRVRWERKRESEVEELTKIRIVLDKDIDSLQKNERNLFDQIHTLKHETDMLKQQKNRYKRISKNALITSAVLGGILAFIMFF